MFQIEITSDNGSKSLIDLKPSNIKKVSLDLGNNLESRLQIDFHDKDEPPIVLHFSFQGAQLSPVSQGSLGPWVTSVKAWDQSGCPKGPFVSPEPLYQFLVDMKRQGDMGTKGTNGTQGQTIGPPPTASNPRNVKFNFSFFNF